MPRPTLAQLVYGSVTVVGSTLAMLMLSQVSSGSGVIVIALAGLALGVMVAMTVAAPRSFRATDPVDRHRAAATAAQSPLAGTGGSAQRSLSGQSLRR